MRRYRQMCHRDFVSFCCFNPHIRDASRIYCPLKGVIPLPSIGYITVHAFTGISQIPLQDVAIAITDPEGDPIALRLTDRSGRIEPIAIEVPDLAASQRPDTGIIPYTQINIYARKENYEQIEAEDIQIFADTVTDQNLQMIPLSELPENWTKAEIFRTTPQNL